MRATYLPKATKSHQTAAGASAYSMAAVCEQDDASLVEKPSQKVHKGSILLIQDNDTLRRMTSSLLREFGYCVCGCSSASAARDVLHSGFPIDLLIIDGHMPGSSAVTLANELSLLHLRLPVIILSEKSTEGAAPGDVTRHSWRFLRKPVGKSVLLTVIDDLLDVPESSTFMTRYMVGSVDVLPANTDTKRHTASIGRPTSKACASVKKDQKRQPKLLSIGDDLDLLGSRAMVLASVGFDISSMSSTEALDTRPFSHLDCVFICQSVHADIAVLLANLIRRERPHTHIVRLSRFRFDEPDAFTSICDTTYDPELFLADVREIIGSKTFPVGVSDLYPSGPSL